LGGGFKVFFVGTWPLEVWWWRGAWIFVVQTSR
jgi:hypothetical protein